MSQLDELKKREGVLFKKISWLGSNTDLRTFHLNHQSYFENFGSELQKIAGLQLLGMEVLKGRIDFNLLFTKLETHNTFNNLFYIQGGLKESFKECMRRTKAEELAFYMATSTKLAWTLLNEGSKIIDIHRNYFYEIKNDSTQKFFAQLPENKESFSFFQWILSQPQTLSVTAYYDTQSKSRYLQSLFHNYDQDFENQIKEHRSKYHNYAVKRHEHNANEGLIYGSNGQNAKLDISLFTNIEPEYFNYVDKGNKKLFPLTLF